MLDKAYKSQNDEALCSCSVIGQDKKNLIGRMRKAELESSMIGIYYALSKINIWVGEALWSIGHSETGCWFQMLSTTLFR